MDAVTPSGHRRRRSSLINPANASNSRHRSPGARSQTLRTPSIVDGEGKIVEESSDGETPRLDETDEGGFTDEDLHDDEETGLTGKDRRRKKRKKRRNQLLDQRVVSDDISPEEKQEADRSVAKSLLINGVLIGLWYFFSLLISLVWTRRPIRGGLRRTNLLTTAQYNKWMFSPDKLDFRFPMFTTAMHFLVQFSLASLILFLFPSLRPKNNYRSDLGQSRHEAEPERPIMTKMFYLTRIGPCSVATGLDIGLGNTSLQFITLTFYSKFSTRQISVPLRPSNIPPFSYV